MQIKEHKLYYNPYNTPSGADLALMAIVGVVALAIASSSATTTDQPSNEDLVGKQMKKAIHDLNMHMQADAL